MNLSEHFTFEELTSSDYAIRHSINNVPTDQDVVANLHTLAQGLERVRQLIGMPLHVSSGYRCPKLNASIGGSKTSAHMRGLAADIVVAGFEPIDICRMLEAHQEDIGYDQVIQEGSWTHVAFADPEDSPRGEILTAHFGQGGVTYTRGLA